MSSQRRIDASRANGARSLGPVTPEGRARSARNAIRHGLLARTVVLEEESTDAFEAALADLIDRLRPADAVELALIEEMAAAQWRQRRSWGIEVRMMNDAAVASPDAGPVARMTYAFRSLSGGPEFALMHRYETRQTRMFQRALNNLLILRTQFLPNEPSPISEQSEVLAPPEPEPSEAEPRESPAA
jgi:hypothetical protein